MDSINCHSNPELTSDVIPTVSPLDLARATFEIAVAKRRAARVIERRAARSGRGHAAADRALQRAIRIEARSRARLDRSDICAAARLAREVARRERAAIRRASNDELAAACHRGAGLVAGENRIPAARCVEEILRRVGPAEEQARADEARYCAHLWEEVDAGKKGGVCGGDYREISRAWIAPDGSAAILSYVEWGSYGVSAARARNGAARGGLHHLRIRAYLVVRDSTTGARHMIRVPPRFGRLTATLRGFGWRCEDIRRRQYGFVSGTAVGGRCLDLTEARIHAAVAWTFNLDPSDYRPAIEA